MIGFAPTRAARCASAVCLLLAVSSTARADEPSAQRADSAQVAPPALEARVAALEETLAQERAARELEAEAALATAELEEPKLQLYGFMDAGLQKLWVGQDTQKGLYPTTASTFLLGNVNLYVDARPAPKWRVLIENRFSLHPHGQWTFSTLGQGERQNDTIIDFTSPSIRDSVIWSGIILERAQMEWHGSDAFNLTFGYFLTPWGIWNVDHGTPTTIALVLPSFLVQLAVPKQQTGVQASGAWTFNDWQLAYRAFLSNGRTTSQFDLTDDKAIGGRLFGRHMGAATLTLGASGYWGTSQDETRSVALGGQNELVATSKTTYDLTEWIVGADLALDWGPLRIRSEAVQRHVHYVAGKHEPHPSLPGATYPNRYERYVYGLAAYRVGMFEPLVYVEWGNRGLRTNYLPDEGYFYSAGLNVHLFTTVQIKTQAFRSIFDNITGSNDVTGLLARLVVVF